jgi:hypothetical protein
MGGAVVAAMTVGIFVGCSEDPVGSGSAAIGGDAGGKREAGPNRPPDGSGGARDATAHSHRDASPSHDAADASVRPRDGGPGADSRVADAAPEASTDGAPEEDSSAVAACIVVSGTGVAWPPSPAASTAPECVVNCGTAQCGAECTAGTPCDSGCCAGNQVSPGTSASASPDNFVRGVMTRDSAGTFYKYMSDESVYVETPAGGGSSSVRDLDCQNLVNFMGQTVCTDPPAANPLLAVGGPASQRVVYLSYWIDDLINPTFRFGAKRAGQWTFGVLPLRPSSLAADPKGTAWLASDGKLYRLNQANAWINVGAPCGISVESIAIDDSGALYVGTKTNKIWRRDSAGAWSAETTPGVVDRVYVGGGTVHYSARSRNPAPGGGVTPFHYARRVGTTWSEQAIDIGHPYGGEQYDLALDGCGAPHLAFVYQEASPDIGWDVYYLRWTSAGWRWKYVYKSGDPPGAAIGVSTTAAELVYFTFQSNNRTVTSSIPLR